MRAPLSAGRSGARPPLRGPTLKARIRSGLVRSLAPLTDAVQRERPRVRVISLHDIPPHLTDAFVEKIEWLRDTYNVVSLGAAYEGVSLDRERLNVVLTFDDGYREHAAFAAPLLEERSLPATFFVPSGALGLAGDQAEEFARRRLRRSRTFEFMTSDDVASLASSPLFEIGGHTRTHADVGVLDRRELDAEIVGDKALLEGLIGSRLRWFAFPFGGAENASAAAVETLERAGYQAAFTIVPEFWSRRPDHLVAGRDSLALGASTGLWRASLRGGYDPVGWAKRRARARRG